MDVKAAEERVCKGKGGMSGSLAFKEPEVEVFLHYGGSWLRVGEPGVSFGVVGKVWKRWLG